MLAATREIVLDRLLDLPKLIDAFQGDDIDFVNRAKSWLQALERDLGQLRNPLASLVASERGRILSALEGFREPQLGQGRISRRKVVNITTSLALGEVEKALVKQIQEIDEKFDAWREKAAQFISVASTSVPVPLPPTDPRHAWLMEVWANWKGNEATRAMFNYLNTSMAPADRFYLLGELLENHLNGNGPGG